SAVAATAQELRRGGQAMAGGEFGLSQRFRKGWMLQETLAFDWMASKQRLADDDIETDPLTRHERLGVNLRILQARDALIWGLELAPQWGLYGTDASDATTRYFGGSSSLLIGLQL